MNRHPAVTTLVQLTAEVAGLGAEQHQPHVLHPGRRPRGERDVGQRVDLRRRELPASPRPSRWCRPVDVSNRYLPVEAEMSSPQVPDGSTCTELMFTGPAAGRRRACRRRRRGRSADQPTPCDTVDQRVGAAAEVGVLVTVGLDDLGAAAGRRPVPHDRPVLGVRTLVQGQRLDLRQVARAAGDHVRVPAREEPGDRVVAGGVRGGREVIREAGGVAAEDDRRARHRGGGARGGDDAVQAGVRRAGRRDLEVLDRGGVGRRSSSPAK